MRRRYNPLKRADAAATSRENFHEWILSLPWVVERPPTPGAPGVRTFAIDCEPLGIRRPWLVTGLPSRRIAVIVPEPLADLWEIQGIGQAISPMPAGFTFLGVRREADEIQVERVVLEAYGTSLS